MGGGGGVRSGGMSQGGCEQRIDVLVKIKKKLGGRGWGLGRGEGVGGQGNRGVKFL